MKDFLNEKGVDAIIVSDPYNMRYLSGFSGGEGYVYISADKKVIITDSRYTEATMKEKKPDFELIQTTVNHGDFDVLKELIEADKAENVGFEDEFLTVSAYTSFKEKCQIKNLVALKSSLNELRIIKTPEEIEKLRMAESIGDKAFLHVLNVIKPGITELELAAELEYAMKKNGAEAFSFETIAATGAYTSLPHAVPGNRTIKEGDFVLMDFGCKYEGYCSDMTRTVVAGKASDRQKEIYEVVKKAQAEALKNIKAGVVGKDMHEIAAKVISDAGYGDCFGHGLGHSVGLYIHETPGFNAREKRKIQAGTIMTVEPGIYIPDFGGVRIEDMIVVTEDGYDNLTSSPKDLIEIY